MNRLSAFVIAAGALASCAGGVRPGAEEGADAAPVGDNGDGQRDPPGSGPTFLVDQLTLLDTSVAGASALDIDGDGSPDGRLNAALGASFIGIELRNKLSEAIRIGRMLQVIEIAGLDADYQGTDPAVTLKLYRTLDADSDLGNNLCQGTDCGSVVADLETFDKDGQTPYQTVPAPLAGGRVEAAATQIPDVPIHDDVAVALQRGRIAATLPSTLVSLESGVVCGAFAARELHQFTICQIDRDSNCVLDANLVGVIGLAGGVLDIDLDGDGLESLTVDPFSGAITGCLDGQGNPVGEGASCLEDPTMADGYSLCAVFHALPVELLIPAK